MALKRERARDGKQKLLCYAKEAGGLPTSRSIYADLQSGAGWRKHGSCLVSSLCSTRAGGNLKQRPKRWASTLTSPDRRSLRIRVYPSCIFHLARSSLCCYETLPAWLVAAHSAISLILALALRSAARFLRTRSLSVYARENRNALLKNMPLRERREREWMQMSPKAQERSGKTFYVCEWVREHRFALKLARAQTLLLRKINVNVRNCWTAVQLYINQFQGIAWDGCTFFLLIRRFICF
jgi:hypothetical protein